jgi:hypothetical protein
LDRNSLKIKKRKDGVTQDFVQAYQFILGWPIIFKEWDK